MQPSPDLQTRLADDRDPLRQILRACRSWTGPPPTAWLGEPIVTTHQYDTAGQMVRSETRWSRRDVDLALALHEYEAGLCRGCGDPLAVTTRPENDGAYRTSLPIRCHKCTAVQIASEVYQDTAQASALSLGAELDPERVAT